MTAIRALEPVVNLARLQIRGRHDDGRQRLLDLADDVEDVTAAANKAARALIEHNKGEAISAFDDPFWRRYYFHKHGWLQDLIDGSRDMAKALDKYADVVHGAVRKLEHELEIVGATIVAGTALAIFTAGISEGAAAAATASIVELAGTLGVTVSTEVATIAGTTLATAALAGIESVTVDLAVAQPIAMATGEQKGGLNLDEARQAGLFGALTGGLLGGGGAAYQGVKRAGGLSSFFDGIDVGLNGPRLALAGIPEDLPTVGDPYAMRVSGAGEGGSAGAGAGKGPWPASSGIKGPAAGKELKPPHARHTISGSASGQIREVNSVTVRGYEQQVNHDVADIAAGRATFNDTTGRYEVNGRSYGVEETGRVFPDSGEGIVKLDRNEYAALQQIAKAKGDIDAAPQLTKNPRFTNNPEAVQKALAVYNGTYQ